MAERIELNLELLFRWFGNLGVDDLMWDATAVTKNRNRLLNRDVAVGSFAGVLAQARVHALVSSECFSADGTLLEEWVSRKRFRPKDGSGSLLDAKHNGEQRVHGRKQYMFICIRKNTGYSAPVTVSRSQ